MTFTSAVRRFSIRLCYQKDPDRCLSSYRRTSNCPSCIADLSISLERAGLDLEITAHSTPSLRLCRLLEHRARIGAPGGSQAYSWGSCVLPRRSSRAMDLLGMPLQSRQFMSVRREVGTVPQRMSEDHRNRTRASEANIANENQRQTSGTTISYHQSTSASVAPGQFLITR